jgi:hypothetical protein
MSNSTVLSVKVPPTLLEEIRESREEIDWPEEIRAFMRERLRRWKGQKALEKASRRIERLPPRPRGYASASIREDRDGH